MTEALHLVKKTLHLDVRDDGVGLVRIDVADAPVNTLRVEFADELDAILERAERDRSVRGLVFTSAKPDNFVVGADLAIVRGHERADELEAIARRAQRALGRLSELGKPTAAAIHGTCLGGGLELALACDLRIASDSRATRLGMPEVQLGLSPGAGGTQRLPRLVGLQNALELLLTGKSIGADDACDMGLVHEVCPAPIAVDVACQRVLSGDHGDEGRSLALTSRLGRFVTEGNPVGRHITFDQARKKVQARTRGNYPAPPRIIDVVEIGLEQGLEQGLEAEAAAFGDLATTPESHELVRLFFLSRELDRQRWVSASVEPRPIRRVGVVGAGTMGSGIAYITAATGLPVRVDDVSTEAVARGLRAIRRAADRQVRRGEMTEFERDRLMHRVGVTTTRSGFHACDLVIEAVVEDLEVKREVLADVQEHGPERVIVASNTSSLPIARLASVSDHPEAVIGMHYFSPVTKVPLLEIVVTQQTAPEVLAACVDLGRRQGKHVIVVNDRVGFYTTRILAAYLNEALRFLERGAPIDHIDEALRDLGFPMGPLEVADSVGIDVARDIGDILEREFGGRFEAPSAAAAMVGDDRLGQKNRRGFYLYEDGERGAPDPAVYELIGAKPRESAFTRDTIAWACTLRMVDEAVRCRDDGVLRSERDGDAGAVFGLGFPPLLGGPFRLIETLGVAAVVERMRACELVPSPSLVQAARDADSKSSGATP